MIKRIDKNAIRKRRHKRVRKHLAGTSECPRLFVYRSLSNIYAQVIDDANQVTLVSASSLDSEIRSEHSYGGNVEVAKAVGKLIGERAKAKGIESVVFDRGGYIFHGRVAAVAEGAREAGLDF